MSRFQSPKTKILKILNQNRITQPALQEIADMEIQITFPAGYYTSTVDYTKGTEEIAALNESKSEEKIRELIREQLLKLM